MIKSTIGNILDSHASLIVNPVNCCGVSGAGLALQFKGKYPTSYEDYKYHCRTEGMRPGDVYSTLEDFDDFYLLNVATKDHWRHPSRIEWIERGVENIAKEVISLNYLAEHYTLAIPKLGCGYGGLDWAEVKPIIVNGLKELTCQVVIYE